METQTKYLSFKGIDKKEQILFKSFINLAKNELAYEVVILRKGDTSEAQPDILILDEHYEFSENHSELLTLPTITIGKFIETPKKCYIARPVQWSDFKKALSQLNIDAEEEADIERVLPDEVELAIEKELLSETEGDDEEGAADQEEVSGDDDYDYDFELGHMSADYYSFTNSDYVKVANEVQGFKEGDENANVAPVVLMTDDESTSTNSVLVLETNSFDAWDYSESEITISVFDESSEPTLEPDSVKKIARPAPRKKGVDVDLDEEYWGEDSEIIVDDHTLLYIKAKRKMVYSTKSPCKWPAILQRRGLSKLPLRSDWRPTNGLTAYPLSSLIWVNTLIRSTDELAPDLDEQGEYMLDHWPDFNLLELDNILLKLCTMLFVRAESVQSLAAKSGYGRSTIIGLMNACHEMGLLITPDKLDASQLTKASNDEGMLGRIRDVFR